MEITNIWAYDQSQVLDDKAAIARGHVRPNGSAALHGTWTRLHFFRIREEKDRSLTVFDEEGRIARFVPDAADPTLWAATADPRKYSTADADWGDPASAPKTPVYELSITPTLVLAAYTADDLPSGCDVDDLYLTGSPDPAAVAAQRLSVTEDGSRIEWSMAGTNLTCTFFPIAPQEGPPSGSTFSDTFAGATEFAQTAFPFYGFNPLKMLFYSEDNAYELPGTPAQSVAYTDRPGQTFIAPLIFDFPAADSRNYVRSPDLTRQPNLPIGRRWLPVETSAETRHTQVLSSVADRLDSWSTTFGMSAGVPGMFSLGGEFSYHDKIETQKEKQCRYVVSRAVSVRGVNIIHVPSVALRSDFVKWLGDCTTAVLAGKDPDWKSFVRHYGSHYLHAMTYGSLKYGETRMSLDGELKAETAGFDVSATAEATIEDVNLKSEAKYAQEWSNKLQTKVEVEDVDCYDIGGPGSDSVGIIYDLRPITELLSPVLVAYNPADAVGGYAPWIWTRVRASLQTYLDSLGLGAPIDDRLRADYRPRTIRVAIGPLEFVTTSGAPAWAGLHICGGIILTTVDTSDLQKTLEPPPPIAMIMAGGLGQLPTEIAHCVVATRAQTPPAVTVRCSIGLVPPVWDMQFMTGTDNGLASYFFENPAPVAVVLPHGIPEGGSLTASVGPLAGVNGARIHDGTLSLSIPAVFTDTSGS